ncbi:hypothetical protein CSA80_01780 [Candidatus Saccharibacteria bacterium]|nr:MAG: hypothetical protein CSA80_01780 [Candidatus Saccharibacteria bacterium]
MKTTAKGTTDRTTKYVTAVRLYMQRNGHATNAAILNVMRSTFGNVSATTIYRVTARMLERGELRLAPPAPGNVMRLDARTTPHDHFVCEDCGMIKDVDLGKLIRPELERLLGDGCHISGSLTVSGTCAQCRRRR